MSVVVAVRGAQASDVARIAGAVDATFSVERFTPSGWAASGGWRSC